MSRRPKLLRALPPRRKPGAEISFFRAGAWQAGQSVSGAALIYTVGAILLVFAQLSVTPKENSR